MPRKAADNVSQAGVSLLQPIAGRVLTLTADNGKEFAGHEQIAHLLGADFYLARMPLGNAATTRMPTG